MSSASGNEVPACCRSTNRRVDGVGSPADACRTTAFCPCVHVVQTAQTGGQLVSSVSSGQGSRHTDANTMPPSNCRAIIATSARETLRRSIGRGLYHMPRRELMLLCDLFRPRIGRKPGTINTSHEPYTTSDIHRPARCADRPPYASPPGEAAHQLRRGRQQRHPLRAADAKRRAAFAGLKGQLATCRVFCGTNRSVRGTNRSLPSDRPGGRASVFVEKRSPDPCHARVTGRGAELRSS